MMTAQPARILTTGELGRYLAVRRQAIERALFRHLQVELHGADSRYAEAVRYALFPGGKRLRPALVMLGSELIGGASAETTAEPQRLAAIVEYLHTSSLILDDLPCMDNASTRRGRPCTHLVWGEALSILVSVGLLNAAYGLALKSTSKDVFFEVRVAAELVDCIGIAGMIAGQAEDLLSNGERSKGRAGSTYNLKTSALIRLSLRLGALSSGASDRQLSVLSNYSDLLGEAYQLNDDLEDRDEDGEVSSSTTDIAFLKSRGVRLAAEAEDLIRTEFGSTAPARILCELARSLATRIERSDYPCTVSA